jgi:hypothetical protein
MLNVLNKRVSRFTDLDACQDLGNLVFRYPIPSLLHLLHLALNLFGFLLAVLQLNFHEMGLLAHSFVLAINAVDSYLCLLEQYFELKFVRFKLRYLLVSLRDGLPHQCHVEVVIHLVKET